MITIKQLHDDAIKGRSVMLLLLLSGNTIGLEILLVCFLRLYILKMSQCCHVNQRWDSASWNWDWIRLILGGMLCAHLQ